MSYLSFIQIETLDNFMKTKSALTFDVPYDFESLMHYHSFALAIDEEQPTILKKVRSLLITCF